MNPRDRDGAIRVREARAAFERRIREAYVEQRRRRTALERSLVLTAEEQKEVDATLISHEDDGAMAPDKREAQLVPRTGQAYRVMEILDELWQRPAAAGTNVGHVFIMGETGVGKTRLLAARYLTQKGCSPRRRAMRSQSSTVPCHSHFR